MNSKTKQLKEKILNLETVEERLNYLKDTFKGKKAVILAPGPTLAKNDLSSLSNREDIVILAIKQAYDQIKGQADFHIVNTYNFDKYNGYEYEHLDTIIFYGLSKSYVSQQMEKLAIKPHPCDIWVPVMNPPYITYEQCMHKSGDWDKMLMLQKEPHTWWGTSILFEQAIPMALLLGCNEIFTIGWDMTTGQHSYDHKNVGFTPMSGEEQKTLDSIEGTKSLYDWCEKYNIIINILSDVNQSDKRFSRLTKIKEI
tara:strand:- start:4349 stop:5113 length:765 start_codon:yes stop_codon:yes gene_type:complete